MPIVDDRLSRARGRIRLGYGLVVVENALDLLWPFSVGLAVDGLIEDSLFGLGVFVVLSLSYTAAGFGRQLYETRTFNRLYADVSSSLVEEQRGAGIDTATVSGRTELAGEYLEFLETDVPLAITSGFTVLGSLGMLFLYDPVVGLVALLVGVPELLLNRWLMARSKRLFRDLNDLAEAEVDVIERGRPSEARRHFGMVGRLWIRLSDTEATSWSTVEFVAVGLWILTLVRITSGPIDVGDAIAMIAYVAAYTAGFEEVPGVLQRLTRLRDIRRRLDTAGSTGGTAEEH